MDPPLPNSTMYKKKKMSSLRSGFFSKLQTDLKKSDNTSSTDDIPAVSLLSKTKNNLKNFKHNLFDRLNRTKTVDETAFHQLNNENNDNESRIRLHELARKEVENSSFDNNDNSSFNEMMSKEIDIKSKSFNSLFHKKNISKPGSISRSSTSQNSIRRSSSVRLSNEKTMNRKNQLKIEKRSYSANSPRSNRQVSFFFSF